MIEAAAAFADEEAAPVQWGRNNIYVLELSEGHLCFTGTGRLTNLFLQKQADGTYRTFDMFGSFVGGVWITAPTGYGCS